MTVYKYFIRIALKHKFIIIGYLILFLYLSFINGASTDPKEVEFMQTKLEIGVIDNCNKDLSKGLTSYLGQKNNIVEIQEDEDYIREQIFLQVVDGVIIIPPDFEEKVINKEPSLVVYKNDRKTGASYLEQQIEKYLVFANGTYMDGIFDLEVIKSALNEKVDVEIVGDNINHKNPGVEGWFKSYYNFTSYIIIAIYVAVIGLVMMEFKEDNIENRVRISSKNILKYNRDLYLGQISIGAVITSIFIIASILLKGKYIGEVDFIKYVINIIVFSFAILCFTFLISNLTKNRFVINGVSTVVSLGTSFISGVMVPQEFLGPQVLSVAKFFPTYYFIRINERRINTFMDIRYEIFMQLIFGLVFLLMGLYFSKVKGKA